jgi:hypothetical protein
MFVSRSNQRYDVINGLSYLQNMSMVHNQRINGGIMKGRAPPLARLASENSANQMKPKLIRQTAILADGDSTGSSKSVKFQEPQLPNYVVVGGARR